jgi:hypothetical protein
MTKDRPLPAGTRVRYKYTHWFPHWNGLGTMLDDGTTLMDGRSDPLGTVEASREGWAKMRDQTPNLEHALAVSNRRAWIAAALCEADEPDASAPKSWSEQPKA